MKTVQRVISWISEFVPVVTRVVKKAAEVAYKGADYVENLIRGRDVVEDIIHDNDFRTEKVKVKPLRPDVMNDDATDDDDVFSELSARIDESKKILTKIKKDNESEHDRIKLQIDIMELIISAQTVDRFTNNINLHAANLQIHLQTIQNTAGLVDNVNRQRTAIKALMKTVNHLINVTGNKEVVKPIEGVDVDMRQGAISIYGAYEAFENTKGMLLKEVESYTEALSGQIELIERIRGSARKNPGQARKVDAWIEGFVEPSLHAAKKNVELLMGELNVIPKSEASLRRDLKAIQDANADADIE